MSRKRKIIYEHPLKNEIYKKGYTLYSFADEVGINRSTLNSIFKNENKTRGDTIYLIAKGLNTSYEKVEKLCNTSKRRCYDRTRAYTI